GDHADAVAPLGPRRQPRAQRVGVGLRSVAGHELVDLQFGPQLRPAGPRLGLRLYDLEVERPHLRGGDALRAAAAGTLRGRGEAVQVGAEPQRGAAPAHALGTREEERALRLAALQAGEERAEEVLPAARGESGGALAHRPTARRAASTSG